MLFLWSQNAGELGPADVAEPLVAVVVVVAVATALLGLAVGDLRRAALVVTPVVLGALMFGHVERLTEASTEILMVAWAGLVAAGLIAAWRLRPARLATVDRGLLALGSGLVALTLTAIVPTFATDVLAARPAMVADRSIPSTTAAAKRDVYWLVFDRYGSDRSFELQFGVRNDLTPWLRDHGFTVLDDSHANYVGTGQSLATTLNMTHLDELAGEAYRGSDNYNRIYAALNDSPVVRQFQALGYRYLHLGSWWNPTRTDRAADVNYNADTGSDFSRVLLETSAAGPAMEALGIEEEPPTESAKHLKHNTFALATLEDIPDEAGPKFVFAHILLPHPPYIYDRDGRYIDPDEAATLTTTDAWERQLVYTNDRIKAFLERLPAVPEAERPIVILQADEGPWTDRYGADKYGFDWASASAQELEIKFGIMNAWYVPGQDLGLDPEMTAINTFPTLFSRYFGLYHPALPDRVYTSLGWGRPYDLTDVTDRLPSLR